MTFSQQLSVHTYDMGNPLDVVLDNTGPSNQALYEGSAYPGTSNAAGQAKWRIRKFLFDANNQVYGWRWANGTTQFDKDWDARATYTYASL